MGPHIDWPPPYTLIKPDVTFEDFLRLCDEDTKADLMEGELIVHSPASNRHEDLFRFLLRLLDGFVEARGSGAVRGSRFPMKLSARSAPEPDLMYVADAARLGEQALDGPADFIIEIVSPSSRRFDLEAKKDLYLNAGVREYWVVEPDERRVYVFPGDRIIETGRVTCAALAGFWIEADWLWSEPMPPVAPRLARIIG